MTQIYKYMLYIHKHRYVCMCILSHLLCSIANMSSLSPPSNICVLFVLNCFLLSSSFSSSWCPTRFVLQKDRKFEQKTDRFWEYEEQSNNWVEVELPYDLFTCVGNNCTKVGSISSNKAKKDHVVEESSRRNRESVSENVLPLRKRLVSLRKMSETSIWVTGQSGSIYERFWNGVQWVIAPHDLHPSAAPANSVFIVNHTILALSEAGYLYQMQLSENSQPVWVDFSPTVDLTTKEEEAEQGSAIPLKSGVISYDAEKVFFCTKNGSLLELVGVEPPRWLNHGRPPGANVEGIADAGTIRLEVIFTISSSGDLYEYDRNSKPSWKKHIWREIGKSEGRETTTVLKPLKGSVISDHGLNYVSLFLLTKGGNLIERRLTQRKWKWAVHEVPEDEHLSSITTLPHDESNEKFSFSLFFTSVSGNVWEYKVPRYTGSVRDSQIADSWVNHVHPPQAKVATCLSSGLQFQIGRIFFPLDDGRLAELHHTGLGGETMGPNNQNIIRRKGSTRPKYVWSVLDAPETEGWNVEYCTEERGPTNCIMGIKDEFSSNNNAVISRGQKSNTAHQSYLIPSHSASTLTEEHKMNLDDNLIRRNFRLRVMHGGKSFFLVTESGVTFEYLNTEQNVWLWLRHEHELSAMRGAVGDYNGSLFLIDERGSLLIRERNGNELAWLNCTAMKKGRPIIGGPPWNKKYLGRGSKVTTEDSLFFVSKTGRLMQFIVALRKFKWKDCKYPPPTKIASIVDQEGFRDNIVFVIGRNGRLYQYNKVTDMWHEHRQSQHLVLSRLPGTAMRSSSESSTGSLFMLTEDGGLVEYHWDGSKVGWNWVEHGTPHRTVSLVGSTGPCFQGNQLFLIGLDGYVYLRYLDHKTWRWKNCGFPYMPSQGLNGQHENTCIGDDDSVSRNWEESEESQDDDNQNCDSRVAPVRPIPFSDVSVIFELRDGRLAEMRQKENGGWVWLRTIGTPTSLCISHFWTGLAS